MNIRIVQKRERVYNDGRCPLFLRFSHNRQNKYITTGIAVLPEHWDNDTQLILNGCPDNKALNGQITKKLEEYRKQIRKLEILEIEVNFDTLFGAKSKRINCTVSDYFSQQVEHMRSIGKIGTALKYGCCLTLLSKCNPVNIRFEQIDMNYLRNFETYLLTKGNMSNSIASKFSVFKAVYNKAIADGVFEPKDNPFNRFKVGKYWKPTRKRAISKEDVLKIKALELPEDNRSFYLRFARDIFLFSYYTAGINFKDIATLTWNDIENGRIYYQRHKTSKEMSCCLMPEAKQIIERYSKPFYDGEDYIFPILDKRVHKTEQQIYDRLHKVTAKVNENLKLISKEIDLKNPITTYVARHTFATVLKRSGVNIAIISESLGHSDLATTQIYLDSFENSQIDEAMKNLL